MKFNKKRISKSQMMREGCMYLTVTYSDGSVIEFKDFDELNKHLKFIRDLEKNDIETFNSIEYIDLRFCIGDPDPNW